jgi:hypothetical protein
MAAQRPSSNISDQLTIKGEPINGSLLLTSRSCVLVSIRMIPSKGFFLRLWRKIAHCCSFKVDECDRSVKNATEVMASP